MKKCWDGIRDHRYSHGEKNALLFLLRFDIFGHNKKFLLTGVKIGWTQHEINNNTSHITPYHHIKHKKSEPKCRSGVWKLGALQDLAITAWCHQSLTLLWTNFGSYSLFLCNFAWIHWGCECLRTAFLTFWIPGLFWGSCLKMTCPKSALSTLGE